jgi:cell division protein FtsL
MKRMAPGLRALFERRLRGFRVVELAGGLCLVLLVLGVYFFKAGAGAEGAQIADATRQIAEEERRVRALRAELARLESPERLERLAAAYLGMGPVSPKMEADPATVGDLVRAPPKAPGAAK